MLISIGISPHCLQTYLMELYSEFCNFFKPSPSALTEFQVLGSVHQLFKDWGKAVGISAYFYDAMTAYAKGWLQFVFPIYISSIA